MNIRTFYRIICLAIFWLSSSTAILGKPTIEYFPADTMFDSEIDKPESFLNFEIGEWHISPELLTAYVQKLAEQSDRVSYETIGFSHERRPVSHLYISSPENIKNLDQVLTRHRNAKKPSEDILVVKLAYSIHGNEASGSNTVPLFSYYLAAGQDPWIKDLLSRTVIIIEPVQNPDGLARFATWANQHKGLSENFDNAHREHREGFPSGRTNHYWFDLNRDWIFAVHPESKARIKAYQKWRPHVLGDYHEMGGNIRSYFFQPGHPKRTHPLTTKENQRITLGLAKYHADALDERAQPYYTEERFDDFYYGKGSAYPDASGAIGLLFEQSSVRGHARELGGEKVLFSDGIANHLATSLSLIRGADELRNEILAYRFKYKKTQSSLTATNPVRGYVFSDDGDPLRAKRLLEILRLHNIPIYELQSPVKLGQHRFEKHKSWMIKTSPEQYGLISSLFDNRTTFDDNVFYDVSTWNLPLAFNLPSAPVTNLIAINAKLVEQEQQFSNTLLTDENPIAYTVEWNQLTAPHLLQSLLKAELFPRLAVLPFSAPTQTGETVTFEAGAIVIQPVTSEEHEKLRTVIKQYPELRVHGLTSGLTPKGPDLGSRSMKVIKPIKPALLVASGVTTTEAGEIRYAVDVKFGVPLTILDLHRLNDAKLTDYTHLLLPNGKYNAFKELPETLKSWVKSGGILIAQKDAAKWVEDKIIFPQDDEENANSKKSKSDDDEVPEVKRRAYQDYEQDVGKRTISGAVLRAEADLTHPLAFGFNRTEIPVFYNAKNTLAETPISYDMPIMFAKKDLLITGYADKKKLGSIANTPAMTLHRSGKGKIVLFGHNPNFRAIWLGTERLFANALFFTQAVDDRKDEKPEDNDRRDAD